MSLNIIDKYYRENKNPFKHSSDQRDFVFYGKGRNIYVYPDTHNKEIKDIGWKQLIVPEKKNIDNGIDYILQNFSKIRISECVQETKIDSLISAIKSIVDGFKVGKETFEKMKEKNEHGNVVKFIAKVMSSNYFISSLLDNEKISFKFDNEELEPSIKLVYALQYCLMNREINNVYEFPYDNQQLYVSNGAPDGWKHEESGWGETSSHSIIGKMLNFIGSQIRIMSEPIWQGTSQDSQTQIQVKVNLFNNTIERAISNYKMINHLMPNNLYLQYGVLQQAPSYYDVHIFGNRRYPLCKANFTCNAKGLFRKIDIENIKKFPQDIKIGGKTINDFFKINNHELRIPDVYELDLNFQSLLPDSFNDFLYFWYLDEMNGMNPIDNGMFNKGEPEKTTGDVIQYATNPKHEKDIDNMVKSNDISQADITKIKKTVESENKKKK